MKSRESDPKTECTVLWRMSEGMVRMYVVKLDDDAVIAWNEWPFDPNDPVHQNIQYIVNTDEPNRDPAKRQPLLELPSLDELLNCVAVVADGERPLDSVFQDLNTLAAGKHRKPH
jgi:hypothetical protein